MRPRYLLMRLLYMLPTVLGAVTLVFIIIRLAAGNPVDVLLGEFQGSASPEVIAKIKAQYGFDKPFLIQYLLYMKGALSGDLGISIFRGVSVTTLLLPYIRPTAVLAVSGLAVALLIGIPAGVISAVKRNQATDYVTMTAAVTCVSVPAFWFALLLIYIFGYRLAWFPMYGGPKVGSLMSELWYVVLPAVAVGARSAALLARMSRSAVLEVLGQDYIRTARAKGLSERLVLYRHALRNALIPIVTVAGMDLGYLLGGTVIVETVFARPGLGRMMIEAYFNRDYPVAQGAMLLFIFGVVLANMLTDFVYTLVDPAVKLE